MKYLFLFVLAFTTFSLCAQEYDGAESYWERKKKADTTYQERSTVVNMGGSGSYLSKGGGLLIAGDLLMLGSAMTALGSTLNYDKKIKGLAGDQSDEAVQERERLDDVYYTGMYVSAGMVTVGFILRMAGHINIKRAGDMFPINDKTAMNITGDGLTLCYRF